MRQFKSIKNGGGDGLYTFLMFTLGFVLPIGGLLVASILDGQWK